MTRSPRQTALVLATPRQPGAVALIQLHGPDAGDLLGELTQRDDWPAQRVRVCDLGGIDTGLAVRLDDDWAQLMPHGGLRVVQRVVDRLIELGARYDAEPAPRALHPEAPSAIEADVLATIAQAASPAAIELLAHQPTVWRHAPPVPRDRPALARSDALERLIAPATVVVVGRANVGKSTLTNAVLGKSVSVVADLPGTTRDWVGAVAELDCRLTDGSADPTPQRARRSPRDDETQADAVAVRWLDTPGLRGEAERVEHRAIELARRVISSANVVIAMRDPATSWPEAADLPRAPDVWVMNKVDDVPHMDESAFGRGESPEAPLPISAATDRNLAHLAQRVLATLGLDVLDVATPWAFSPTLRRYMAGERVDLGAYVRRDE